MKKSLLFLAIVLLFPFCMHGQGQITVTGTVLDTYKMGVPGASIVEKGTTNGTITDFDGNYSLTIDNKNAILVFSFIGYKTQEISLNGQTKIDVVLEENAEQLDEVVVTGYGGSQKRATLTTSISKLDNAVLENAAMANAGQSLQGTVSGLRVVNTTGKPGADPNIVLRGGATLTGKNNGALIVVDGIVRNSLADINPADIESIQVLKDAASTAIYGARANGGVILVTTKRGKEGTSSVTYKFKAGANFARYGYDFLDAEDYIYYNRLGYARTGRSGIDNQAGYGIGNNLYDIRYLNDDTRHLLDEGGWQVMNDPANVNGQQIIFKDHSGEPKEATFKDPSFTQDHYLNFTGGNDKATFAASLGYYKEDGMVIGTSYERFSGTLNASYKILPFLTVNGGVSYTWSRSPDLWDSGLSNASVFYRTLSQRPTWNPWLEDGTPASGIGTADGNPQYYTDKMTQNNGTRRNTYNMGFKADLLPENKLVLNGNASLYHVDYQKERFNKAYQYQTAVNPNTVREAYARYQKTNQQQLSATLTYTDTFKEKHNLEAMVGGEYFNYHVFNFEATTQNSPSDDIPTLNAGSSRTKTTSKKEGYRILSGFARVNYNYEYKYLLSLVARYDGISKLSDNRWGFFPGVSAGWNMHEEEFFKDSKLADVVNNLKPRLSWGVNGNVNGLGYYDVYGTYEKVTNNYNNSVGFYNNKLINGGLKWEQSQSFEAGLDVGFFNNRLSFIFDYYNRTTKNLLADLDLPLYTGYSSIKTNSGTLRNQGFEMEVRANILTNKKGWSWEVTANLSTVANKVIKLPGNGNDKNRQGGYEVWDPKAGKTVWVGGLQEGGKLGDMFGYKQDHIFKDWDDVKAHANNRYDAVAELYGPAAWEALTNKTGKQQIEPGDVCWADLNGDGVINTLDRVKVGNMFPNVTGGFSTTLTWNDLSLYARFDYALGHTLYNDLAARSMGQYQGSFNIIDMVKDTWSEENPNTDLPKFYYADQLSKKNITRSNNAGANADNNSSRFYEKADYLACREITLTWNLPKRWINTAFMQNASVYVTGQNLFYITGYSGTSPEPSLIKYEDSTNGTANMGVDDGRYPTPRTVLLGVSVTF